MMPPTNEECPSCGDTGPHEAVFDTTEEMYEVTCSECGTEFEVEGWL